jgi:CRP-like cAMP-binding protein
MIDPSALQRYSFFGGLEESQILEVLPLMNYESYNKDDIIIPEGKTNDRIRFILEGRVIVEANGVTIAELGTGETVGEMEVLDIMPASSSVRALELTKIISLQNKALHRLYKTDVQLFAMLIMNLARDLSRRLRKTDARVVQKESPVNEWA